MLTQGLRHSAVSATLDIDAINVLFHATTFIFVCIVLISLCNYFNACNKCKNTSSEGNNKNKVLPFTHITRIFRFLFVVEYKFD